MTTLSVTLSDKQIKDLEYKYRSYKKRTDIQHTLFQIKGDDVVITVYKSGKAVFSGLGAAFHAGFYTDIQAPITKAKPLSPSARQSMAGSDEVGTGDYFGPVVVCAAIVRDTDYDKIPVSEIADTKQITDETVRRLAPILMAHLDYSLLVLSNHKYNTIHRTQNMNVIKAKLHNKAFVNLKARYPLPALCVIDQFLAAPSYYKHLSNEPEVFRDLVFETKAENKFIAVACGAIIARNAFLEVFDQFEAHYQMTFPKGAGAHVDAFGKDFVEQYGEDALYEVAKVHFINTGRIIGHDLN